MDWKIDDSKSRSRRMYVSGPFVIEPRFRSSYLGGGRRGSVKEFWLASGDMVVGKFATLALAKAKAANL